MLALIREKFGTVVTASIIGLLAIIFIFSGIFTPKATRGLHEGAVAGLVNGESISISEFNREVNQQIEFIKSIGGGKITDEQLRQFRIHESVFQRLAHKKILTQEARRQGILASDFEVKERIEEIPAFQKDGKFDVATYKQVLSANQLTPGNFEKRVREDLSVQVFENYFRNQVPVSEGELKREFNLSQEKRNIKYVLLTSDSAKKNIQIQDSEVKTFLDDPARVNLARSKYEEGKKTLYAGQDFESAKNAIARNLLSNEKMKEIQSINEQLADQVFKVMSASASSDSKVNSILKSSGLQVKTTGWVTRGSGNFIPGIGEAPELIRDAFALQSAAGAQPKKYILAGRKLVAVVVDLQKPQLDQFEKERATLLQQITAKKSQNLYQAWVKDLVAKSKIETNSSVIQSSGEGL